MAYCEDLFNYHRRVSSAVNVGCVQVGADNPVRIQSMTNTSTMDTEGSVAQICRMVDAGCEIVRLTAQGVREAENLTNIREAIRNLGIDTPLVADIHFNPNAAQAAASRVEKVRINPGNFADEDQVRARFIPFLQLCREHHTAIRIGVNHGSLSARMMDRYGDTPEGMVASCMEYLRICREEHFTDVVISIKASNTLIMVQTVRLLVETMNAEDMHFPLHLGVTEAGEGEDGRIKSALGIGALLADGIGDTIRVSLSEAPEAEVPVAKELADYISCREGHPAIRAEVWSGFDPFHFKRRESRALGLIGGGQVPVVVEAAGETAETVPEGRSSLKADYRLDGGRLVCLKNGTAAGDIPCLQVGYSNLTDEFLARLSPDMVLMLHSCHRNAPAEMRAAFHRLAIAHCDNPVIVCLDYRGLPMQQWQLYSAADAGSLLLDGWADGLMIKSDGLAVETAFTILQAARQRVSKTEYISCPGCGRTMFDLQETIAKVKAGTAHLKGLKIAVMGCIVNGPGEMADADYGYVGAGRDRISLYKGRTCIEKNIPQSEALERLLALIGSQTDSH